MWSPCLSVYLSKELSFLDAVEVDDSVTKGLRMVTPGDYMIQFCALGEKGVRIGE